MVDTPLSANRPVFRESFFVLLALFVLLVLLSWPIMFSFDLWVLKDRGNLLNIDYLLDQHLRLGADAYYLYGLLPLALQRLLFAAWGKGYWPMLAFDAGYVVFCAAFWAWFVSRTRQPRLWLLCVALWSPIVLWVNPTFPYALVNCSVLLTLLLVYEGKTSAALCTALIGWLSVPSIPIIVTVAVSVLLVWNWWHGPDRRVSVLLRAFLPGALTFAVLCLAFAAYFGTDSLLNSLFPTGGPKFYKTVHYGLLVRGSGLDFLAPLGKGWRYYVSDRAGWWIASSLLLMVFAILALIRNVRERRLTRATTIILLCAGIHAFFCLFAYGTPSQHVIFDPVLAAGTLAGFAWLPLGRWRNAVLIPLVGLGALSNWAQARLTYDAWHDTRIGSFYASADFAHDFAQVLRLADGRTVFVLSYATGVHHYFPALGSAESWTLQWGQMLVPDMERLLTKIGQAQIVAEDLTGPTRLIEETPQIAAAMSPFCLTQNLANFRIYTRSAVPCAPGHIFPAQAP